MKAIGLLGALLYAFLIAAPTQAQIEAELESPSNEQATCCVQLVRGWAFVDGGEDVTVRPMVDGVIQDAQIPCCTPRQDVQDMFGGDTPLNSGFAAQINYAALSAGPHTIGVHVTAAEEDTVVINHSIVVVRPGNTEVVQTFDLTGASCTVDGNELVIANALVEGVTTDLRTAYAVDSQSLLITDASGGPAVTTFIANLTSNQVVPRVDTDSEGFASLNLNPDSTLTYSLTTTSLEEGTTASIHIAPANENGPELLMLTGGPTDWAGTTPALTPEEVTALMEGRLYIEVNTAENPEGEIRGHIVAAPPA